VAEALIPTLNQIDIQHSPQYAMLVDCVLQAPSIGATLRAPNEGETEVPACLLALVIRFMVAYVDYSGSLLFDEQRFEDVFNRLSAEIEAGGWRWNRVTPLHNFVVPPEAPQRVSIGPGAVIRPLEDLERDFWHNITTYPEQLRWSSLANVSHAIELEFERPRHGMRNFSPDLHEDDVVFALRMCGPDTVSFGITEQSLKSVWSVSRHFPNFRLQPDLVEEKFIFNEAIQQEFVACFAAFSTLNQSASFQFAKRRYNDGCSRRVNEDRVGSLTTG
jgi:hypothetical protein